MRNKFKIDIRKKVKVTPSFLTFHVVFAKVIFELSRSLGFQEITKIT